jgi:choline dehydrogenase-like flavoprotein
LALAGNKRHSTIFLEDFQLEKKIRRADMNKREFDAIVVGSGPGGSTTAKELSAMGKKVLILEWGKHRPIKGHVIQAGLQVWQPGKCVKFTPDFATVFRGIISGGSSIYYYGTAFEPPLDMFKKFDIDISSEIEEIKSELPVQPLDDALIGPMAERIMHSARELGYDWQKLPKFIYQDKCKPDCWRCNYGCPYDAKWSGRLFVNQALENHAEMIEGAKVRKVLVEQGKAIGVEYSKNGRTLKAEAPLTVISAGGIGSPLILNNSGIQGTGKDFFFDPLISVMGAVEDIKGGKEIPMATGVHMEEEGYLMTDMTIPGTLFRLFNAETLKLNKLFSHSKTLSIMVKAKDDLGGYISKNGRIRKRVDQVDRDRLQKGFERASEILKNAGVKDVYKSWYLAAHPGGTAKVGEIVDNNLQTEIENLYVCDCSVIPEAWGLPPTFSLVALGKRLAKHLQNR